MKIRVQNKKTGADYHSTLEEFRSNNPHALDTPRAWSAAVEELHAGKTVILYPFNTAPWSINKLPDDPPAALPTSQWSKDVDKLRAKGAGAAIYSTRTGEGGECKIVAGFYETTAAEEAAALLSESGPALGVTYGVLDLRRAAPKENQGESQLVDLLERAAAKLKEAQPSLKTHAQVEIDELLSAVHNGLKAHRENVNVNAAQQKLTAPQPEKVNRLKGLDLEDSADLIARHLAAHIRNAFEVRLNDRDRRAFNDEVVEEIRPLIVAELVKLDAAE